MIRMHFNLLSEQTGEVWETSKDRQFTTSIVIQRGVGANNVAVKKQ